MEDTFSLDGTDTHVPALDGDVPEPTGDDLGTDIPALADEPAPDTASEPAVPDAAAADPAVGDEDPLLAKFAARTGLDPKDPGQRKTLDSIVAKEKYILELQGKLEKYEPKSPAGLTKFERDLQGQAQQPKPSEQPKEVEQPRTGEPQAPRYNDAGRDWKSPADAYTAISAAWAKAGETGDYGDVIGVDAAIFARRADAIVMPQVEQLVNARLQQFFDQHVGPKLAPLTTQVQEQQAAEAVEAAYADLEATPEYSDIRSLNVEAEGPPLVVNGETYRNTPLNRILVANPWVMHIKREHADPVVADRLTNLERLKAAHRLQASTQIPPAKAKALVDAGSQQEKRRTQEQTRQALNSGRPASTALDQGKGKNQGYVGDLLGPTDGHVSFTDL